MTDSHAGIDPAAETLVRAVKLAGAHQEARRRADELRVELDAALLSAARALGGDVRTLAHSVGLRQQSVQAAVLRAREREGGPTEIAGQTSIEDLLAPAARTEGQDVRATLPAAVLASFPGPVAAALRPASSPAREASSPAPQPPARPRTAGPSR